MKWALVFLLLPIACSQQFVCPDGSVVGSPDQCAETFEEQNIPEDAQDVRKESEDEGIEIQGDAEEVKVVAPADPDVEEIQQNARKRVQSMKFLYVGPPDFEPRDTFYVRGDQMKVYLLRASDHKLSQSFTHVYLDLEEETAEGFCEVQEVERCKQVQDRSWTVDFNEYRVMSPMDWVDALTQATHEGGGEKFENRQTKRVRFETNFTTGIMNVLDYYSIPAKIILDNGEVIEYRDLEVNTVSEENMDHPRYPGSD